VGKNNKYNTTNISRAHSVNIESEAPAVAAWVRMVVEIVV